MEPTNLIAIEVFCSSHEIEPTFIYEMNETGLIELTSLDNILFIQEEYISNLEKMIRLHRDFNLNPEGICAIFQLLEKINTLNDENIVLKNRLKLYED